MQAQLQLLTNQVKIHEAFSIWRNAIEQRGERFHGTHWLPEERVYFLTTGNNFKFGFDDKGENWVVELNEPEQGTENPLSGLARDSTGRLYLLRQGTLHRNALSVRIESDVFEERTGLSPADVTIDGKPAKRSWFIVAALDCPPAEICQNTATFVERCRLARDPTAAAIAKQDDEHLTQLFGKPEQGGRISGQPYINPNQRHRVQGEVSQRLRMLLTSDGRNLDKPRHARGYEVDGEIKTATESLLLEIKIDTTASDVYAGIGQLTVYPKLLPHLADHRRILLLPGCPSSALVEAIRECGVELHSYKVNIDGESVDVSFSEDFLQLCGIGG
ncbi:hypothetical protein [Bradyrhizobium sp. LA2.1]|uniref:hypothetical protein n=1 Tax=Bradyrhizobium sp. LA2.1 TaxID=3156376 RepID=UPI00339912BA